MLRWLHFSKSRALYFVIAYVSYLLVVGCKNDTSTACAPTQYTFNVARLFVYPAWERHFQPHLEYIDQQMGVIEKVLPVWRKTHAKWAQVDEKYALSYTLDKYKVRLLDYVDTYLSPVYDFVVTKIDYVWARILLSYKGSYSPIIEHYFNTYNHHLVDSVDNSVNYVRRHSGLIISHTRKHTGRFFELQVWPVLGNAWQVFSTNSIVLKAAELTRLSWIKAQLQIILEALGAQSSKINTSIRAKAEFVKSEFKNWTESGILKQRKNSRGMSDDMLDVVKTILEDVTSSGSSVAGTATEKLASVEARVEQTLDVPETSDSTVARSIDEESTESSTEIDEETLVSETTDADKVDVDASAEPESTPLPSDGAENEDFDLDSEPSTETVWLTATVFESDESASPHDSDDSGNSQEIDEEVATVNSDEMQNYHYTPKAMLEQETLYWKSKVDKMLKMAYNSLEEDMLPLLNATLDPLKDEISKNFTQLQKENYERYKRMNVLISKINKDFEHMQNTNEIIEHPVVDRQIMRDEIRDCKEAVEQTMKDAEDALNAKHAEIIKDYFGVAQQTVDVIESYAETIMAEFTKRLQDMINVLEADPAYEDKFGWTAWKENHKVKDDIFKFRDRIFDEANQYKENHRSGVKPRGLEPWIEYLGSINFHINFLIRDNEEYLQLVRAKANVAYQMREALTEQLKQAKEQAAQEAAAMKAAEEASFEIEDVAGEDGASEDDAPQPANVKEYESATNETRVVPDHKEESLQDYETSTEEELMQTLQREVDEAVNGKVAEGEEMEPKELEADSRL